METGPHGKVVAVVGRKQIIGKLAPDRFLVEDVSCPEVQPGACFVLDTGLKPPCVTPVLYTGGLRNRPQEGRTENELQRAELAPPGPDRSNFPAQVLRGIKRKAKSQRIGRGL